MLDQLKELLEMQRVLDESIFNAKGITEYPLDNMKVALFVELGELMNEFPTKFKHWKSSAVDNREKGLVEYVDCLHFALSLTNYYGTDIVGYELDYNHPYNKYLLNGHFTLSQMLDCVNYETTPLNDIFELGNYFGFTWDEIYSAYKKKNAVNYERLRNNY
ncbi:dUTP diphosphatase [Methanobrevibacter sp.]|uniref:dUTP diphosphatase n=1 Tax=Methanobrevibacter sp. TaxID=66852 RepID=UPI00388E1215